MKSRSDPPPNFSHDAARLLTADDLYLFGEGRHFRLYDKLGAHAATRAGKQGVAFAVWAPNARDVSVIGDFNQWDPSQHPMTPEGSSGVWTAFIPGIDNGALYKYKIVSNVRGYTVTKADPFAFFAEVPPATASRVWNLEHAWHDGVWMAKRASCNALDAPISIYEVHLGSWLHHPDGTSLSYREVGERLAEHVAATGFTHVELMPVMEHPFYGSWGYQVTGYFAPSSRFGTPQDFMALVDTLHQHGIGVILDWVPSHFPNDEHGLAFFDGTHLYEHADPRKGVHPDWNSLIFNYGRKEVASFLTSSALFWLDRYHVDGLRVDAVASMLYLDYSRKEGQWIPNKFGGRENLEAIDFLRTMNETVYANYPDVQTIAEESTAWPQVSRPVYRGGLGFGMKWDMGWMHDMLEYMGKDPVHRKYHQNLLTFRLLYAFQENFVLSLSHDEVVHGKGSLLGKMPGDDWQKLANLRLLYGMMMAQPGKKLLFMGGEFGQWSEWNHDGQLDWDLLQWDRHKELLKWLADLHRIYRQCPAFHALDFDPAGFEWIDCSDADAGVISLLRNAFPEDRHTAVVANFTPVPRPAYRVGVPRAGAWHEILNSDAQIYGGSGQGNLGGVTAQRVPFHGRPFSVELTLPPLAVLFLRHQDAEAMFEHNQDRRAAPTPGCTEDRKEPV